LKEPDEFITFTGKMIQFARKYQNQLLYGLGGLLVLVLIVSGVRFYTNWKENKAFESLENAMAQYEKSRSEKTDLSDVKLAFQKVVETYSGYDGGRLALLIYANICYDTGDFDAAIVNYSKATEAFTDDPTVNLFIQTSLGYAYEAKKDYQTAANHFERVASSPTRFLNDQALYNLGRLYAKIGNTEKSRSAFEKILSEHPDSLYIELVKERIAI
jgi:tetratricopeptide (TPR) repeat protein